MFTVYLVGGAVRDQLLGLPVKEKDYVVVGSSPEEMISLGFKPVGKDFPVFLHPQTHEEYALARTERKTKAGYHGFEFYTAKDVTLEQDLARRDLTINAMALSSDGELVDPYGGKADLEKRVLRHVSPAFAEDPVRVLRLARFAARFQPLGFTIADETKALAKFLREQGELDALVPERVWQETLKALATNRQDSRFGQREALLAKDRSPESNFSPAAYFECLQATGALAVLFPELQVSAFPSLTRAASLSASVEVRFAALTQGLSLAALKKLGDRYHVGNALMEVASLVITQLSKWLHAKTAEMILTFFEACDAFRRPERFALILQACESCVSAEAAKKVIDYRAFLSAMNEKMKSVTPPADLKGIEIKAFYREVRLSVLQCMLGEKHNAGSD